MSKIQDLFVREKDGYFECVFCQTSFFTLIMFKFHLQTKHTSVTQPVELQNPSHVQAPVKQADLVIESYVNYKDQSGRGCYKLHNPFFLIVINYLLIEVAHLVSKASNE